MRGLRVVTGVAVTGLVFGAGVMADAATKTPSSVKACVKPGGVLSLLDKGKCPKGTNPLHLATKGRTGDTGPRGVSGQQGAKGDPGATGATGATGPSDVYGWEGNLNPTSPMSPEMTVPAGNYDVTLQTELYSGTEGSSYGTMYCALCLGDTYDNASATVPDGGEEIAEVSDFVQAGSAWKLSAFCWLHDRDSAQRVHVVATKIGALHPMDNTSVITLP